MVPGQTPGRCQIVVFSEAGAHVLAPARRHHHEIGCDGETQPACSASLALVGSGIPCVPAL